MVRGRGGMPKRDGPTNKELAEAILAQGRTRLTLSGLMRLRKDVLISMATATVEDAACGTSSP
eukprot:2328879-Heterocapsa_arctica.AAC.1